MTKGLLPAVFVVCAALSWVSASAATGPECGFFEYQENAQEALDQVAVSYPALLDMYQQNLECEETTVSSCTCRSFAEQGVCPCVVLVRELGADTQMERAS